MCILKKFSYPCPAFLFLQNMSQKIGGKRLKETVYKKTAGALFAAVRAS